MIMHVVSPGWRFSNPGSVVKGKEINSNGLFLVPAARRSMEGTLW